MSSAITIIAVMFLLLFLANLFNTILIPLIPLNPKVAQITSVFLFFSKKRYSNYWVHQIGHVPADVRLITALVERWKEETHTFHLPIGEATVTWEDVAVLFGVPIDGKPFWGGSTSINLLCGRSYLGVLSPQEHSRANTKQK